MLKSKVAYSGLDQRCTDLAVNERNVDDFDVQTSVELAPEVAQMVQASLGADVRLDKFLTSCFNYQRRRPH